MNISCCWMIKHEYIEETEAEITFCNKPSTKFYLNPTRSYCNKHSKDVLSYEREEISKEEFLTKQILES